MVRSIKAGRSLLLDVPPKSPEQHRVHVKCLMDVCDCWCKHGWRVGAKMSERVDECVEDGGRDVGGLVRRWMEDYMFHLASGKTPGERERQLS